MGGYAPPPSPSTPTGSAPGASPPGASYQGPQGGWTPQGVYIPPLAVSGASAVNAPYYGAGQVTKDQLAAGALVSAQLGAAATQIQMTPELAALINRAGPAAIAALQANPSLTPGQLSQRLSLVPGTAGAMSVAPRLGVTAVPGGSARQIAESLPVGANINPSLLAIARSEGYVPRTALEIARTTPGTVNPGVLRMASEEYRQLSSQGSASKTTPGEPAPKILPAPFISKTAPAQPLPVLFHPSVGEKIGGLLYQGAVTGSEISRTNPFLKPFYDAGKLVRVGYDAATLQKNYENIAAKTQPIVAPMIAGYQSNVTRFNQNVSNLTFPEYTAQRAALETEKSQIDAALAPMNTALSSYQKAAANLTGNVDQQKLMTYGAGEYLAGLGAKWQQAVEVPVAARLGSGPFQEFLAHVTSGPRQILFTGQAALEGGETIARYPQSVLPLIGAGLTMQAGSLWQGFTTNPAATLGDIAGTVLIFEGISKLGTSMIGGARTPGMKLVEIETPGYDAAAGYPIKPAVTTTADLAQSAAIGKLIPAPTEMSGTKLTFGGIQSPIKGEFPFLQSPLKLSMERVPPPYLHGEEGHPLARLPNAEPGSIIVYTAHETPGLAGSTKVGESYPIKLPGFSETEAVSAAPVLESYFNKVMSQFPPKVIGFGNFFKTPTSYATEVSGIEGIPRGIFSGLSREEQYAALNKYMQERLTEVPGGQAFVQPLKGEYEFLIPRNSVLEVTGRNFYTTVGGFKIGGVRIGGTRVPIVEQKLIGFIPGGEETTGLIQKTIPKEYSGYASINVESLILGTVFGYEKVATTGTLSGDRDYQVYPRATAALEPTSRFPIRLVPPLSRDYQTIETYLSPVTDVLSSEILSVSSPSLLSSAVRESGLSSRISESYSHGSEDPLYSYLSRVSGSYSVRESQSYSELSSFLSSVFSGSRSPGYGYSGGSYSGEPNEGTPTYGPTTFLYSSDQGGEYYKKRRRAGYYSIFREIMPVLTAREELFGFKQGKPFFRTFGPGRIAKVTPQSEPDWLHSVDVDQSLEDVSRREQQRKKQEPTKTEVFGKQFFRTPTKQEKQQTGQNILRYNPQQQDKIDEMLFGSRRKRRRGGWF